MEYKYGVRRVSYQLDRRLINTKLDGKKYTTTVERYKNKWNELVEQTSCYPPRVITSGSRHWKMGDQENRDQQDRDKEERIRRLKEENARLLQEEKEVNERVEALKRERESKNRELLKLKNTVDQHKQHKK